ncbi:hypothetical protein BKA57DRAFT_396134 [Linnemannia elongata]|nr:hypothetical protein BKA57DRAFT_396134 [Linnemannia elongata]
MNHETKEVILKVTDVVKTVVHFGFIPFVIYLGAFFFLLLDITLCADNDIILGEPAVTSGRYRKTNLG